MKFGYIEQLPCILDLKIDFWYMATKQNHPMKRPQTVKWVQQRLGFILNLQWRLSQWSQYLDETIHLGSDW